MGAEILYNVVVSPAETFRKISEKPPVFLSVLTVTVIYLLSWLFNLSELQASTGTYITILDIPVQALSSLWVVMALQGLLAALLLWFILSGALNLLSVFLGGSGKAKALFVCMGFSYIPVLFLDLGQAVYGFFNLPVFGNFLIGIAVLIWIFYLQVTAVKVVQGLSPQKSLLVVISPILVLLILATVTLAVVFSMFLPFIQAF